MFDDPRISGVVIQAPTPPLSESLRIADQHLRWALVDIERGDLRTAMRNIIAANRMHAISPADIDGGWAYIDTRLAAVERAFWDYVRNQGATP